MPRTRPSNTKSNKRRGGYIVPIERFITPAISKEIVKLLLRRGWSAARIAKTIQSDSEFIRRVQLGVQSFSEHDVKTLGRATGTEPLRLLFEASRPLSIKAGAKELHDSTQRVVEAGDRFSDSLRSRPAKRRSTRTKAA